MKRFIQYALALTTVLLLTAVAPEAYAQNRAHNTTKNNTTTSQTTKKDTPSKSGNSSKPSGTTSSNRGSKDKKPAVTTGSSSKPASSTPSKPSSKPTAKPESKPSNHQPSNHQPSGTSTTSRGSKPSSQPSNHQPSAKPDNKPSGSHNSGVKVGGHDDHKGNSPKPGTSHNPSNNKPSSQPGHQPDHKPGKYNGQYESRPTPGHDYGHHMPDRIDRKPGNFHPKPNYHHVDHYFGHFINSLPRGYHSRRYNKIRYYYYDGIYYRRINGYYCICRPPFGVRIAMSLFGYAPTAVWFSPYAPVIYNDCYCLDGVFYRLRGRYYHVIEPPIGAIIPQIPADYEVVMMNGETCYRVEDALYRMVVLSGRICFEVIANLAPRYY